MAAEAPSRRQWATKISYGVAVQDNGRIVVTGSTRSAGNPWDLFAARFTPTGSLDTSFSGGAVRTRLGAGNQWAGDVALAPDGRIVVTGTTTEPSPTWPSRADFALVRYLGDPVTAAASYVPAAPVRTLDTRPGLVPDDGNDAAIGPEGTIEVQIAGRHGVPAADQVKAVVLNVTATQPSANSHLRVYPADLSPAPTASNLNFVAGQTIANLVIAKLSPDGKVKISNKAGTTHVLADVAGWFPA